MGLDQQGYVWRSDSWVAERGPRDVNHRRVA
jgi:hypothetical protein